jgi:hypothetical protein
VPLRAQLCDSPKGVLECRPSSHELSAYEARERLVHAQSAVGFEKGTFLAMLSKT